MFDINEVFRKHKIDMMTIDLYEDLNRLVMMSVDQGIGLDEIIDKISFLCESKRFDNRTCLNLGMKLAYLLAVKQVTDGGYTITMESKNDKYNGGKRS